MSVRRTLFFEDPSDQVPASNFEVEHTNELQSPAKKIESALIAIGEAGVQTQAQRNSEKRKLDVVNLPPPKRLQLELLPTTPQPPPTPRKTNTKSRFVPPKPLSLFKSLSNQAKNGKITYNQQEVGIVFLASGSYMDVYFPLAEKPLVPEVANDKLVIKLFKEEHTGSDIFLKTCMGTSLKFYKLAKELNLPIATIYNAETAVFDGLYIQEHVQSSIDILNPSHLAQVRMFFQVFLQNKETLLLDLLPDNFRFDGNEVKLIDFVEEDDDSWDILIKHAIQNWCRLYTQTTQIDRQGAIAFIEQFTEGFEQFGYKKEWNETIIHSLFKIETFHNKDSS
jgi:hypothetical protein